MTDSAAHDSVAPRVDALDGLRGAAVLAVVALHAGVFPWGWVGVDVFFVLSGFLITGILLDARTAGASGWSSYGKPFYMRRFLRIVPLAWTFLALLFLVAPALGVLGRVPMREQLWYWGFISNWWLGLRSPASWMAGHFWSLAVEEQFYLCWPWIVLATPRHRLGTLLRVLLVAAFVVRIVVLVMQLPPQVGHIYQNLTLARMDGLVAGSLLALLERSEGGLARHAAAARTWLVACGALFVLLELFAPTRAFAYVLRYSAVAGVAAAALLLILASPGGVATRVLGMRWLRWTGTRSYGVYLIHLPVVLWLGARGLAPAVVLVAGLAVTLALAAMSWDLLERPLLAHKRRWPMPQRTPRAVDSER